MDIRKLTCYSNSHSYVFYSHQIPGQQMNCDGEALRVSFSHSVLACCCCYCLWTCGFCFPSFSHVEVFKSHSFLCCCSFCKPSQNNNNKKMVEERKIEICRPVVASELFKNVVTFLVVIYFCIIIIFSPLRDKWFSVDGMCACIYTAD